MVERKNSLSLKKENCLTHQQAGEPMLTYDQLVSLQRQLHTKHFAITHLHTKYNLHLDRIYL